MYSDSLHQCFAAALVMVPRATHATDGPAGAPGRRGNGYYRWDVAQQPVPKNPGKTNGPHSLINCLTLSSDFSFYTLICVYIHTYLYIYEKNIRIKYIHTHIILIPRSSCFNQFLLNVFFTYVISFSGLAICL